MILERKKIPVSFPAVFIALIYNLFNFFSANVLIMNDDCQTPLDVARAKGHTNVVRAIEVYSNISLQCQYMHIF